MIYFVEGHLDDKKMRVALFLPKKVLAGSAICYIILFTLLSNSAAAG
jgi:hypothetical protein